MRESEINSFLVLIDSSLGALGFTLIGVFLTLSNFSNMRKSPIYENRKSHISKLCGENEAWADETDRASEEQAAKAIAMAADSQSFSSREEEAFSKNKDKNKIN